MKRLLFPLLAALALPNVVNANWFSGDLIVENGVGEKIIIKNTAVDVKGRSLKGFFGIIKSERDYFVKNKKAKQSKLKEIENEYEDCLSEEKKQPGTYHCGVLTYDMDITKREIIDLEKNAKHWENLLKKITKMIEKRNQEESVYIRIRYTPIFQDINGRKDVGSSREVMCENPLIFNDLGYKVASLDSLERKICQRYAKF